MRRSKKKQKEMQREEKQKTKSGSCRRLTEIPGFRFGKKITFCQSILNAAAVVIE
jgi:hypothetical protein